MDSYAEEGASLLRSRRMVGDILQTGQESLGSLVEQRSRLKVCLLLLYCVMDIDDAHLCRYDIQHFLMHVAFA